MNGGSVEKHDILLHNVQRALAMGTPESIKQWFPLEEMENNVMYVFDTLKNNRKNLFEQYIQDNLIVTK